MKRNTLGLQVPVGTADILPQDQAFMRQLERGFLDLFVKWAYEEVSTPALEYLAVINPQIEKGDSLYKFFDREGNILALRPELTTPIARMVATRLKGSALPLRLCYAAEVFRYGTSARREFRQAGVELVGSSSPAADAEVITLAVDALRGAQVNDFQINLGQIEIIRGLISDMGLKPETGLVIEDCLARKDFVALELALIEAGLTQSQSEVIMSLPSFHGGEEVLDRVEKLAESPRTLAAINNLREVYAALDLFGVRREVGIDLGVLRGFDYYTGVVFEGYAPGLGFPLIEGGRYDGLLGNFGFDCPATGFAVNMERLVSILTPPSYSAAQVLVTGRDMQAMIERARALRAQGLSVEIALEPIDAAAAKQYADSKGIARVETL